MPSLPSASLPPPSAAEPPRQAFAQVRQWQSREPLLRQGDLPAGKVSGATSATAACSKVGAAGMISGVSSATGASGAIGGAGGAESGSVAGGAGGAASAPGGGEGRLLARWRVGQAVRARLREVVVGPLNRLEWALRVELEGGVSGSRGGWRRWRRGVHLPTLLPE